MQIIDFRSDTLTQPTKEMLEAMMQAKVGDDVFGEDETVNKLEEKAAQLFGMEAGLYCASGTMSNQIAIKMHTKPGDEVICDELSHVYQYEGGGIASNAGASVQLLHGNRGRVTADLVAAGINNPADVHKALSKLVVLENTSNRGGGSCYELADIEEIKQICIQNNLKYHLDGARLFNAMVAKSHTAIDFGSRFDSISICLSKGLGAPIGSVLLGTKKDIQQARRIRKVFGGGMRQAGFIAAAGIYALDHHINRLSIDHEHAKQLEQALVSHPKVATVLPVETNIVIFTLKQGMNPAQFVEQLKSNGVLCVMMGKEHIRFVTHLDITPSMIQQTMDILQKQ